MVSRYEYGRPELPTLPEYRRGMSSAAAYPQLRPLRSTNSKTELSGRAFRRRVKIVACGILFVAMFGMKLAFPTASANINNKLLSLIDGGWDYKTAIANVGAFASTKSLDTITALIRSNDAVVEPPMIGAFGKAQDSLTEALPAYENKATVVEDEPVQEPEEEASEPSEPAEETPAVVSAFIASQSQYADMGIPTDVSYDMAELGVDCVAPITGRITDSFGWRVHPLDELVKFHYGTDIGADIGETIGAFAGGTVYAVGDSTTLGLYVIIDHDNGVRTEYAHCSEILVSAGDVVGAGQEIARAGQTGVATGPHLHFELTKDGVYLNPEYYVQFSGEAA